MKSLREYIDLMATLDQKQPGEEGAIGAAIGGGLGGIAGSALGPLGIVGGAAAGAALGSKAGDFLSDIFDTGSKTQSKFVPVANDPASPTGFSNASTGANVEPPKKGFSTKVKQAVGMKVDDLGVPENGYKKHAEMIFTANTSLKPGGGEFADNLKTVEQARMKKAGWPVTVRGTWDFNGAALALMERDQYFAGNWFDFSQLGADGPSDAQFYQTVGYNIAGHQASTAHTKFGGAHANVEKYIASGGQEVIKAEVTQLVAFTKPDGDPGLHLMMVQFLGPIDAWSKGGQKALINLANSVDMQGLKPIKG